MVAHGDNIISTDSTMASDDESQSRRDEKKSSPSEDKDKEQSNDCSSEEENDKDDGIKDSSSDEENDKGDSSATTEEETVKDAGDTADAILKLFTGTTLNANLLQELRAQVRQAGADQAKQLAKELRAARQAGMEEQWQKELAAARAQGVQQGRDQAIQLEQARQSGIQDGRKLAVELEAARQEGLRQGKQLAMAASTLNFNQGYNNDTMAASAYNIGYDNNGYNNHNNNQRMGGASAYNNNNNNGPTYFGNSNKRPRMAAGVPRETTTTTTTGTTAATTTATTAAATTTPTRESTDDMVGWAKADFYSLQAQYKALVANRVIYDMESVHALVRRLVGLPLPPKELTGGDQKWLQRIRAWNRKWDECVATKHNNDWRAFYVACRGSKIPTSGTCQCQKCQQSGSSSSST